MDNRLVLAVALVMFAWMSACTSAQSNTTVSSNTTTASMSNATTASMSNATTASMSNATTASMGNATTASMGGATTASMSNATTASMSNATTASMSNVTAATGGNSTMNAPATAAPLAFNDTVVPLSTNISRAECGRSQLCAAQPSDCDPSSSGSCFFIAAQQISGQNFAFQLSGESDGYLAASLSTDTTLGGNDTTYVCANNNGIVQFLSALLDNNVLTVTNLNVNSVKGAISGRRIQCTFSATVPDSTARASQRFSMIVSTGNFTNGTLGAPTAQLQTNIVDLANPNATVTDALNNTTATTATPNTTSSHAITLRHSLSQALLIVLGVLGLAMLS